MERNNRVDSQFPALAARFAKHRVSGPRSRRWFIWAIFAGILVAIGIVEWRRESQPPRHEATDVGQQAIQLPVNESSNPTHGDTAGKTAPLASGNVAPLSISEGRHQDLDAPVLATAPLTNDSTKPTPTVLTDAPPRPDKDPDLRHPVGNQTGKLGDDFAVVRDPVPQTPKETEAKEVKTFVQVSIGSKLEGYGLFSPNDPKVERLRFLKYDNLDLSKVPSESRYLAAIALNELVGRHSTMARETLKMLEAYLIANGLQDEWLRSSSKFRVESRALTYQEGVQLATTYVTSSVGAEDYRDRLLGVSEELKERVAGTLSDHCIKEWPELVRNRQKTETIQAFLESIGKLDDYFVWTENETKREETERRESRNFALSSQEASRDVDRQRILGIQQARESRLHELRMRNMENAFKLREEAIRSETAIRVARYMRGWNPFIVYPSNLVVTGNGSINTRPTRAR